jgi:hypothetical protein
MAEKTSRAAAFPKIGRVVVIIFCLIFLGWMLFFTLSKAHEKPIENWWIAKNPENPLQPYYFLRSYIHKEPFHLIWGFEGLRKLPDYVNLMAAGLILLSITLSLGKRTVNTKSILPRRGLQTSPILIYAGTILLSFIMFFTLRVSYENNRLFGDAYGLPGQAEDGFISSSEILTRFLFNTISALLNTFSAEQPGYYAIAILSCLAGGLFLMGIMGIANRITEDVGEKVLLFIALVGIGTVIQFFGYIETTALELSFMGLFFASALQTIYRRDKTNYWLWAAMGFMGLALLSHAAGLLLMPGLVVLLLVQEGETKQLRMKLKRIVQAKIALPFILLIVLPFVLALFPYFFRGALGDAAGGGDHIPFVLLKNVDYAQRPSVYINYDMLSLWHLTDVLSTFIVGATTSMPLILVSVILRHRSKEPFPMQESQALWLLGTTAVSCGLIPIIWNHDYGMWGDWNIATTYLFPLHVFSWVLFLFSARRFERDFRYYFGLVIPLLITQWVGLLGLALQFYG